MTAPDPLRLAAWIAVLVLSLAVWAVVLWWALGLVR